MHCTTLSTTGLTLWLIIFEKSNQEFSTLLRFSPEETQTREKRSKGTVAERGAVTRRTKHAEDGGAEGISKQVHHSV
jgi:hypothetical protein